jgi:hypothetical protein
MMKLPCSCGRYLDRYVCPLVLPRANPEGRLAAYDVEARALNKASDSSSPSM